MPEDRGGQDESRARGAADDEGEGNAADADERSGGSVNDAPGMEADSTEEDRPPSESSAPVRVCRKCAVQSATFDSHCPNCGASYVRGLRRFRRRRTRVLVVALPLAVLLAGAAIGTYLKLDHDADMRAEERERQEAAEELRREAERASIEAEQEQAEADTVEVELRELAVTELEAAIQEDADENIAEGILDGPAITEVHCDPAEGTIEDLATTNMDFECLAANQENDDGTIEGYSYSGNIDFDTGEMTWSFGED